MTPEQIHALADHTKKFNHYKAAKVLHACADLMKAVEEDSISTFSDLPIYNVLNKIKEIKS